MGMINEHEPTKKTFNAHDDTLNFYFHMLDETQKTTITITLLLFIILSSRRKF